MLKRQTLTNYFLIAAVMIFFVNCKKESVTKDFSFEQYFTLSIEQNDFFAQIAISKQEQSQGLMFRNNLDKNHGMLFAFEDSQKVSFWMKNVSIPLEIGYFDSNGRLIEIHELYPYDEKPVFSKSNNIQYALEMKQGWFHRNKIRTGNYLNLEKAIKHIQMRKYFQNFKD
ncbi:DUF192 domain-containing protein [Opitutae bacterium]|nr:DUF192 domain-containing protein [Opitutae bacterium]